MPFAGAACELCADCSITVVMIRIRPDQQPSQHPSSSWSSSWSCAQGLGLAPRDARRRSAGEHRRARPYCATAEVTGLELSCFFFQSPMAARIASSANSEQWIFTGGSDSSFTMSMFLMASASSTVLPLTHSVAKEELAMADPHPNVLNLASSMILVS